MATTTQSAAAAGLLLPGTAASGPPSQEPSFFPLLSLPRDVLALVIALAGRDKAPWRLVCAQLRDMMDSAVTALSRRYWRQEGLVFTSQLIMRLPRLEEVDIKGCGDIRDLTPLAACINLQTLDCGFTAVGSLAPLASCTSLHVLNCRNTAVSSLEPLASCTSLHTLYCSSTAVSSLEPLSWCTSLHTLDCSFTAVSSLAPLASCTSLHTLHCYDTSVSSLAPLASCTALMKLVCNSSLSTNFEFMKNAKIDSTGSTGYYRLPIVVRF